MAILSNMRIEFISAKDHYEKVIERATSVKKSLWIDTAEIKDPHVKAGNKTKPFLGVLADLLKCGVEIRLIHIKEASPAFREDFFALQSGMPITTATQF